MLHIVLTHPGVETEDESMHFVSQAAFEEQTHKQWPAFK